MLYGQKKTKLSRLNLLIESYLSYKLVLVQHVSVVVSGGGMVVVVWWYGGGAAGDEEYKLVNLDYKITN